MLILKITLVPLLIAMITWAGRHWGPHIAGWLSSFPVVAAPVLFFISVERGVPFASISALGMFSCIAANVFFSIVYAWLATRLHWFLTLLLALAAYAVMVALLNQLSLSLWQAVLLNVSVMLLAPHVFPAARVFAATPQRFAIELPLRMLAAALLVLTVTHFAEQWGSRLSGMLAMFPLMASILAVFSHRNLGKDFAVQLLRGALLGWYAFFVFSLALVILLPRAGIASAFVLALLFAILVQMASLQWVRKLQAVT